MSVIQSHAWFIEHEKNVMDVDAASSFLGYSFLLS